MRGDPDRLTGQSPNRLTTNRSADDEARCARVGRRWQESQDRLRAFPRKTADEVQQWQLEQVRALVDRAYATHPFYHWLYKSHGYESGALVNWSDYQALPTVSKADILDNFPLFAAQPLSMPDVFCSRTSGSTGRVLTILQDQATSDSGQLFYLRHYEQMLGRCRAPEEVLLEVYLAPHRYPDLGGDYQVVTLSQDCDPIEFVDWLAALRPTVLSSFPSYLLRVIRDVPNLSEFGVETICTHSEGSTPGERRRISQAFRASVTDEYSSEELYLIASSCDADSYHIVDDNVRIDVESPDGLGTGEIVGTSLVNDYMPFIRYRQGDIITLRNREAACPCGRTGTVIEELHGRADQMLVALDGSLVPPDQVMGLYDRLLLPQASGVAEFHLEQLNVDRVRLHIVVQRDCRLEALVISEFCEGLRTLLKGTAHVEVVECESVPSSLSHKRRVISSALAADRNSR